MIDFAEATEQNGTIVVLDQEKAYKRINHKYLWKMMEKFNIPVSFIQTVQYLYKNAFTVVMIKEEKSSPF